jgi:hypothetical protein
MKLSNEYSAQLGKLYHEIPKAVFAAIAVSALTGGGDRLDDATAEVIREWSVLHRNGIIPQTPPARLLAALELQP